LVADRGLTSMLQGNTSGRLRAALPLDARVVILALLVVAHVWSVGTYGRAHIGPDHHFLADDDVMISLRYARNLASGAGPVYNPDERIEGFTNPLLVGYGALLHAARVPSRWMALVLDVTNLGFSLTIAAILLSLGVGKAGRSAGLVSGALYVMLPQHVFYAHAGYEVYAQALLALVVATKFDRAGWLPYGALALLPLTHATSATLYTVGAAAILAFGAGPVARRFAGVGIAAVPVVLYQTFRVWYYGEWVPNTYYLKVGGGSILGGAAYLRGWCVSVAPGLLLACLAIASAALAVVRGQGEPPHTRGSSLGGAPRAFVAGAMALAHAVAVVLLGGDYFPMWRFLLPCAPLVLVLASPGAEVAGRSWRRRVRLPGAWLVAGLLGAAAALWGVHAWRYASDFADIRRWNVRHVEMGLALQKGAPPDSVVALLGIGHAGYYGGHTVIDMLGKVDPRIARVAPNPRRRLAHNKSDFPYVLARRPDYIELNIAGDQLADIAGLTALAADSPHGHQAELALHPSFRRDYAGNPVFDTRGRFLSLYARPGAPVVLPGVVP
jgi:hypothetical protein